MNLFEFGVQCSIGAPIPPLARCTFVVTIGSRESDICSCNRAINKKADRPRSICQSRTPPLLPAFTMYFRLHHKSLNGVGEPRKVLQVTQKPLMAKKAVVPLVQIDKEERPPIAPSCSIATKDSVHQKFDRAAMPDSGHAE